MFSFTDAKLLFTLLSILEITHQVFGRIPLPLAVNWDAAYSYSFDYEKIKNKTNELSKRISFTAVAHFRQDPENHNSVICYFEQPNYSYNDQFNRNPYFTIPVDGLHYPFRINYDTNGLLKSVYTHEKDGDLSVKFKKTLASLVQIDWEYIEYQTSRRFFDYNFTSPEITFFGECHVINHVTQIGEGRILTKDILLDTCVSDKVYSRSSLTAEFKFRSSREKNFHYVNLNGIEYVPGSDTYSILSQRLDFKENVKARYHIDNSKLTVERIIML